jgi:hypothetical protein
MMLTRCEPNIGGPASVLDINWMALALVKSVRGGFRDWRTASRTCAAGPPQQADLPAAGRGVVGQ